MAFFIGKAYSAPTRYTFSCPAFGACIYKDVSRKTVSSVSSRHFTLHLLMSPLAIVFTTMFMSCQTRCHPQGNMSGIL